MKTQSKSTRLFSMILALCLLAGALPAALAENSFAAVVTAESMGVYSPQSPYDYLGALPKGTQVTVEAYSGSVALIRYKGNAGLARIGDLQAVTAAPAASEAVESTMSRPVVALRDTRVYSKASTRSRYVTVRAGTAMTRHKSAVAIPCKNIRFFMTIPPLHCPLAYFPGDTLLPTRAPSV